MKYGLKQFLVFRASWQRIFYHILRQLIHMFLEQEPIATLYHLHPRGVLRIWCSSASVPVRNLVQLKVLSKE